MANARERHTWLFGRGVDLGLFGGSFALSLLALAFGALSGLLDAETPSFGWVVCVLLCDVAHVWATLFRTYLDPHERKRRARLFTWIPIIAVVLSLSLYALGKMVFWRTLTYVAIFHFIRQQYGWVMLYRGRAGDHGTLGRIIDTTAIYASTLYPLVYWHTHLPRRFSWFIDGDLFPLPAWLTPMAFAVWVVALCAYAARAAWLWSRGTPNPGKDLVVFTTAIAWYVGIVTFDSDYAFTVTNVFMHGIPYFGIVFLQSRAPRRASEATVHRARPTLRDLAAFFLVVWALAFFEELLWDRAIWHERTRLFGEPWELDGWEFVLVPLLSLPQLSHYLLDAFIWKRKKNPSLAELASPERREALP